MTTTTMGSESNSSSRGKKKVRSHSFHCGASEATYYRDGWMEAMAEDLALSGICSQMKHITDIAQTQGKTT